MGGLISRRWLVSGGLSLAILCSLFLYPSTFLAAPGAINASARPYDPPPPPVLGPTSASSELPPQAYLPMLMNCYYVPAGIYGYVTKAGVPAGSITVKLMLRNNTVDSEIATVITNSCGYFSFLNVPSVKSGTGKGYFVRFHNGSIVQDALSNWDTHVLTSYQINEVVNIENFDIGDISLVAPIGSTPLLIVTFNWTKRNYSPTDSYIFYITEYNPALPNPYNLKFYTSPLGFVDNVQIDLNILPSDMNSDTTYYWYISIIGPYPELESNNAKGSISKMCPVQFLNIP